MATSEAKAKAPAKEAKAEKKEPKRGVGTVAKEAIRGGATNEAALATVKKEFPEAKTTMASVAWYRNNLRQAGEKIPTAREQKTAAKATTDKTAGKDPTA